MKQPEVLSYQHVTIYYGDKMAADNINFSLHQGEILAIVGASGSGKSTLLKASMGLLGEEGFIDEGNIYYTADGADAEKSRLDLTEIPEKEMRHLRGPHLAMITQNPGECFCPVRRMLDLFYEEGYVHKQYKRGKKEKKRCARNVSERLAHLGLSDPADVLSSFPFELSGGMLQRCAIAMALMLKPNIILADEPTASLDVYAQQLTIHQLLDARSQYGTSVLLVTHNIALARYIADRILVLKDGRQVEYGDAKEVLAHPKSSYTRQLLASVPHLVR